MSFKHYNEHHQAPMDKDSPKHRPPSEKNEGKEESLTTLLDEEQRGELTLLIATAAAAMRKTITSSFDANVGISQDLVQTLSSEYEKIMNPNINPGTADVSRLDGERKLKLQREKELSAPAMKELKQASLKFFDEWRTNVIVRVGEVVNSREQASSDMKKANPPDSTVHAPPDTKVDPSDSKKADESAESSLSKFYPPIETPLSSLDEKSKILIIHSMLLLLLSLEHYIAPSRVLLLYMTSSLHLPIKVLAEDEEKMAKGLLEAAKHMSGEEETKKKAAENKDSRKWKVGLASVAGAALIGVTGGLAAPLVAAGVGSVMGGLGLGATAAAGYLGSVAGSTVLVGGLFGAYGGRMTGQMMDNYAREVEDFAFLPVRKDGKDIEMDEEKKEANIGDKSESVQKTLNEESGAQKPKEGEGASMAREAIHKSKTKPDKESQEEKEGVEDPAHRRLRVTIGITGWLTSKSEVVTPWRVIGHGSEVFALRFELEALMNLGNSMQAMVSSAAWGYAKSEMIKHTIFAELANAMWPVALLKVARVVDNPFSIARSRAEKAGEVLADALINKAQGERPVTLIGYSLGARVIYSCLMSLAKRRAFGLIESVVLIGAPAPSTTSDWRVMRSVVASRLVNVYSENDYVLGFLYRTSSVQYGVAGLQKIEGIPSVENVDVSETVSGHLRYRYLVGSLLKKIGFEDIEMEAVIKEEEALKKMDEEEKRKKIADQAKKEGGQILKDNPLGLGKDDGKPKTEQQEQQEKEAAEAEATKMEKEVQEKTSKGMLVSAWGYLPTRLRGDAGIGKGEKKAAEKAEGASTSKVESMKEKESSWASSLGGYLGSDKDAGGVAKKGSKESLTKAKGWAGNLTGGYLGGGNK
ncbi:hypothetical protein ACLMJK_005257 [Lecanora helva]